MNVGINKFSLEYYSFFIELAKDKGYKFCTLTEFIDKKCPSKNHFIIRHDIDREPLGLEKILDAERDLNVRSTNFVRVAGSPYNFLDYPVFDMLKMAEEDGFEIGLHSNFLEFANINGLNPNRVLKTEIDVLSRFFNVRGMSSHRDINYCYNSLPEVEKNWKDIRLWGLDYQAYDKKIMDSTFYVNEGLNPHLCWRTYAPEEVIPTGDSIYLLTHNHWWYLVNPFERAV